MDNKNLISVYGALGFVGGEFCKQFPDEVIRIPKHEVTPQSPTILYFISSTDNYNIFDSPTLDIETNLLHFMDVLDACHKTYGTKFEFNVISSWFVYGKVDTVSPITEDSYCNPTGFYSITARTREQLLISYCETFGIKYRILRLSNVLGSKDKKVSKKKNALQFLIDRIIMNEDIELYYNGEFYRDYIDVRDCAKAIRLAMKSEKYDIFNISNGNSHKFKSLIDYVMDKTKSKSNVWDKVDKPNFHSVVQIKDVWLSNQRLQEEGYVPQYSIWETLDEIINDYKR